MMQFVLLTCFILSFIAGGGAYEYETKFSELPVDHFTFTTNHTFKLRYLENSTYWKPKDGAPIFFYTGNEGNILNFAENTGFMWEIAPEFSALVVFAEHRYYGLSLPFGNQSFTEGNIGYLTSLQALADYVDLIAQIKKNYNLHQYQNPVYAFGGSYGGMLAAWMRMKYPASISGSIASSAPIWQFTDLTPCTAFNDVISKVFKSTSESCYNSIKNSWTVLSNFTATDKGKEWLTVQFKMCNPIKTNEDVDNFKGWLKAVYTYSAMLNYPYPSNFVQNLPANPVAAICEHLNDTNQADEVLLKSLFDAVSVYFNETGSAKCLDVQEDTNDEISESGWNYQSCTEMVMPMCDDGNGMFEPKDWNFPSFSDWCYSTYGVRPQPHMVEKIYGGKHLRPATNIIFSNGLLDPWSSGGVLKSASKDLPAIIIPDGAHHLDLRASNPADPKSVKETRKSHVKHIKKWIKEYRKNNLS